MNAKGKQIRVAIVEDHALQRKRTEELVRSQPDMEVVNSTVTLTELMEELRHVPLGKWPDIAILDLMVERGPSVTPELVSQLAAHTKILVISALASPPLVRAVLRAGVGGVVGKRDSEQDIMTALRAVLAGEPWLTAELAGIIAGDPARPKLSIQEERALVLYSSGLTLDEVALALNVRPDTAKKYLARVKTKYSDAGRPVHTKVDLNRVARDDGYLSTH